MDNTLARLIMNRLDSIERLISSGRPISKWVPESVAMELTGLSKESLRKKRVKGELAYSTASGKKIKYLLKELEDYLNKNSTLTT